MKRKHIFLIMTDQQRFDTIAALGFGHMHTPNMDRLVREGTSFDNCFVNA
ncbi:MAG: sulfatase-like hydrolase/transferase, partial [Burkholderiales bacterium]|nr:sulfatase-like hydrolase/transferase [Burkholderiales bacterium]